MKNVLLVRHASAGCDDMSLADRFRPVDARGERQRAWPARCAREQGVLLQPVVSNAARRPQDLVAGLDDALAHAAVLGPDPEPADLGRHFAAPISHLPRAGMAMPRFDAGSWRDAVRGRAAHAVLDAPLLPRTPGRTITSLGMPA